MYLRLSVEKNCWCSKLSFIRRNGFWYVMSFWDWIMFFYLCKYFLSKINIRKHEYFWEFVNVLEAKRIASVQAGMWISAFFFSLVLCIIWHTHLIHSNLPGQIFPKGLDKSWTNEQCAQKSVRTCFIRIHGSVCQATVIMCSLYKLHLTHIFFHSVGMRKVGNLSFCSRPTYE